MSRFAHPQKALAMALSFSLLAGTGVVFRHQLCQPIQAFCDGSAAHQATLDTSKELAPNYLPYSPENLASAHQKKHTVILYFWAPWCASCSSLDLDIQAGKAQVPDGVTLLRVNYDSEPTLKQKYNVVIQHTFVRIDDNNNPQATWVGGDIAKLQTHL